MYMRVMPRIETFFVKNLVLLPSNVPTGSCLNFVNTLRGFESQKPNIQNPRLSQTGLKKFVEYAHFEYRYCSLQNIL